MLAAAFLIKASAPELPWGLNYRAGTVQPTAPILSDYCSQARGNQLIVLDLADDLYASVLPLARLRYATMVPVAEPAGPYTMPFAEMGITRDGRSVQRPCPLHAPPSARTSGSGRSIPATRSLH